MGALVASVVRRARWVPVAAAFAMLLDGAAARPALAAPGDANTSPAPAPSFRNKLTMAFYDFSSGKTGADVNLRHTFAASTAWLGVYHESTGSDQVRAGYEYDYSRDWLRFVPSVQAATKGVLGATVYAEIGPSIYGIVGAGRTNLEPYWNLGFDPNEYVQFGGGYRDAAGNTVSVNAIHDNRLHTGQTNTHFYARRHLSPSCRLTVDVGREHGTGDGGLV